MDEWQLACERDGLQAFELVAAARLRGAGRDAGVVGGDEAAHSRHVTDPRDAGAAGDGFLRVGVVAQIAGERHEVEKRRARVEQQRQALARQELAALLETRA